jgi:acyl carrier protein
LHLKKLNDFIGTSLLEGMRAVVPVEAIEWKGEKKVAGVSSFGFSGTNAQSASWSSLRERMVFATGLVVVGSTAKEVAKLLREASEEEGKVVLGKEVMVVGESASGKEEEALAAARGAAAEGGTRAELPTYQFSRKVYWVDERKQQQQQGGNFKVFGQKVFVDEGTEAFLANAGLIRSWYAVEDHVVYGALVMPGAAHLTAVMEQKKEGRTSGEVVLRRVELRVPVVVEEEVVVQYVHHAKDGKFEVRSSGSEGSWKLHVVGEAEYRSADGLAEMLSVERRQQGGRPVEAAEFWDTMQGVKFGPSFRWLEKFRPEGEDRRVALCWLRAPENWTSSVFGMPAEVIDATVSDAVDLVNIANWMERQKGTARFMAPFAMDEVTLRLERGFEQHSEDMVSETRFVSGTERTVRLDARLYQDGVSVLGMRGLTLAGASEEAFLGQAGGQAAQMRDLMYEVVWTKEDGEAGRGAGKKGVVIGCVEAVVEELERELKSGEREVERFVVREENETREEMVKDRDVVVNVVCLGERLGQRHVRLSAAVMRLVVVHRQMEKTVVYTVTERAHSVDEVESGLRVSPWARAVWSMGRAFGAECGERVTHVMVDLESSQRLVGLKREVDSVAARRGAEVAIRGVGERFTASLEPVRCSMASDGNYCLSGPEFRVVSCPAVPSIPAGFVKVFVQASGLNASDLEARSSSHNLFGFEFAGFADDGRRVFGFGQNCFVGEVVTKRHFVASSPDGICDEDLASVPSTFFVAYALLEKLGKVGPDGMLLIDRSLGLIGDAALQLAGVEFGWRKTVLVDLNNSGGGTVGRVEVLGVLKLGLSSRHVIDASVANMTIVCEYESTTAGVDSDGKLRSIAVGGLAELLLDELEAHRILSRISYLIGSHVLQSLTTRVVPLVKAEIGFKCIGRSNFYGKVVFCHPVRVEKLREKSVVISGAFGGLGEAVAGEFCKNGKAVILFGRAGAGERHGHLLKGSSSTAICAVCNVVSDEDVSNMVRLSGLGCDKKIGSILHLAGAVEDGLLQNLNWAKFRPVLAPKVAGLRSLKRLQDRGSFVKMVLFSSVTSLLGNAGQTNYGAANGFLDGFAESRNAISVNWGAWDVGMYLLNGPKAGRGFGAELIGPLFQMSLLGGGFISFGIVGMDWSKDKSFLSRHLVPEKVERVTSSLAPLKSKADVESLVVAITQEVLGSSEVLDEDAVLQDLGFDSVLSVELRQRIGEELKVDLPATLLYDYPTVKQMKQKVSEVFLGANDLELSSDLQVVAFGQTAIRSSSVVVAGFAARFADVCDPEDIWSILVAERDMVSLIPRSRVPAGISEAELQVVATKWGSFVKDLKEFDAAFFNISPREAVAMDPQHRMLLECSWGVIESAGMDPMSVKEFPFKTGVYVGISGCEYGSIGREDEMNHTGTAMSTASGRVSYILGLTAPPRWSATSTA